MNQSGPKKAEKSKFLRPLGDKAAVHHLDYPDYKEDMDDAIRLDYLLDAALTLEHGDIIVWNKESMYNIGIVNMFGRNVQLRLSITNIAIGIEDPQYFYSGLCGLIPNLWLEMRLDPKIHSAVIERMRAEKKCDGYDDINKVVELRVIYSEVYVDI